MEITVARGGMLTTVQDLGRRGHRGVGVPLSGAADPFALRMANLLVGNPENAAALETTLVGPELVFTAPVLIAVTGATFEGIPGWRPLEMGAGQRLRLGPARLGCRGYLAVAGGIDVPLVLGSRSTYLRGRMGGFGGRPLHDGDTLSVRAETHRVAEHWRIDERILPAYSAAPRVRVIRGAHADEFGGVLFESEFRIMLQSDRMGIRLGGARLARIGGTDDMVSSAVAPGTIQIPPDGQPIILMADAQTIGGYPQAAHVIAVDLPLVAQLRPGDRVTFAEVSLPEAQQLAQAREHILALLHEGLAEKVR
ncbi:MAG: urea amidolyase related protein [Verrucomicrobia bacterium]|nr:urea amidolyase related protein [Verrucomicrobiota bacterium]